MKISVLTVCYNAEATIRHTLESFLAQDHRDKEMWVIDGASTDGTTATVGEYVGDRIRLLSEPDRGMYDALNKGLERFSGDAVGVLNADDTYHDDTILSRIAEALEDTDMVHGDLNYVDNHDTKTVTRRWRAEPRPETGFRSGWMPAHPTFYARRYVAEAVGAFDLTLPTSSDYDWMIRAIDVHGFSLATIDHVMVDMQLGGTSTASLRAHWANNWEVLRARRRWLDAGMVDYALIAKPARKIGQYVTRKQIDDDRHGKTDL
ncbi:MULTISPECIES: glycosyltransferase family 2 protein [unclassified Roseitalea]|uniref:glycosyltransferase family 2 protein n=1 Tax=unclassified Roseitalea TaxID=2639107 RepID=UPI00273F851E|nr:MULTISPECIES: glycosyltransferase family 2 protein [unclassified Roseitalea]